MARSRPRRATPGFKWEGNKLVPLSTTKWNDETQDWDINPDESDLADDEIPVHDPPQIKKDDDHSLITGGGNFDQGSERIEFGTDEGGNQTETTFTTDNNGKVTKTFKTVDKDGNTIPDYHPETTTAVAVGDSSSDGTTTGDSLPLNADGTTTGDDANYGGTTEPEHTGGVQSGATGSTGLSLKERQALLRGEKIYRDGVEIDKDGRPVYQGDAPSTEVGGGGHDNAPGATPVESHEQTSINWQTNQHQAALDARDRDIASRGQARRGASAQDGNKAESGSLRRGIRKLSPSLVTGGPK
jgi:hypothetical protein